MKWNMVDLERLRRNLEAVQARIAQAIARSGRAPGSARLVTVTKRSSADCIAPLLGLGACDFGENYPQELVHKFEATAALEPRPRWHLIGHLQTNKVKKLIGPLGSALVMIHAIDSLKLLDTVSAAAESTGIHPDVCLQVNTSDEESKHGWSPEGLMAELDQIVRPRAVRIVGLMTMAALGTDAESARGSFVRLRELRETIERQSGLALPELSMGMTNDFETAVEEGATLVRVGSAIFEGVES